MSTGPKTKIGSAKKDQQQFTLQTDQSHSDDCLPVVRFGVQQSTEAMLAADTLQPLVNKQGLCALSL
jgi:hypothetical protein